MNRNQMTEFQSAGRMSVSVIRRMGLILETSVGIFVGAYPARDKGVRVQGTLLQLDHQKGEFSSNALGQLANGKRNAP